MPKIESRAWWCGPLCFGGCLAGCAGSCAIDGPVPISDVVGATLVNASATAASQTTISG